MYSVEFTNFLEVMFSLYLYYRPIIYYRIYFRVEMKDAASKRSDPQNCVAGAMHGIILADNTSWMNNPVFDLA